ncbi:hypothetical protein E2542_SST05781 [Spatholobus suberectus]|nr:hypothetical protein E2542_SST05781 [Spatholobus suberectus]
MANKDKNNSSLSSTVRSLAVSIFGGNVKTSKTAAPGGPVATMVAASKHFSSPHKVRSKMAHQDKSKSSFSSTVKSLVVSIFCGNVKTSKTAAPGGPAATMVAASKHFSSPHKVRFG